MSPKDPRPYPIDGVLDLHTFHPSEIKMLIPDYIEACLERDILQIRIIHGKGIGNLRRSVHAILGRSPFVERFWQEGGRGGSWGATIAKLKKDL